MEQEHHGNRSPELAVEGKEEAEAGLEAEEDEAAEAAATEEEAMAAASAPGRLRGVRGCTSSPAAKIWTAGKPRRAMRGRSSGGGRLKKKPNRECCHMSDQAFR